MLLELTSRGGNCPRLAIEQDRAGRGRTLIDCQEMIRRPHPIDHRIGRLAPKGVQIAIRSA